MSSFISQYGTKPKTSCPGTGRAFGGWVAVLDAVAGASASLVAVGTPGAAMPDSRAMVTTAATAATPIMGRRVMVTSTDASTTTRIPAWRRSPSRPAVERPEERHDGVGKAVRLLH